MTAGFFAALVLVALPAEPPVARASQATVSAQPSKSAAMQQAEADLAAGRRAEAAAEFRAIADRYNSVQALLRLARIEAASGDSASLATLERARKLAPNSEEVLSAVAEVSLAARLVVPAILALEPLARMCAGVAQYHYLLGVAFMQAGDMILSVESLQRAEKLEPDRPLTLIALGLALNNRKMYGEAAASLSRALELEPDSIEAMAALAEAEEGLGQGDPAEAHARRVLGRAPDNPTANLVLGLVLMRNQRFAEARDTFERAAAADPHSPKPDYQLSLAYARLGDTAASERHRQIYQQKLRDMEKNLDELRKRTGLPSNGGMK
jgi:tetratricopeptide (TPR) repeat protein